MKFNNTEWPFNDSLVREITVNNFIDSLETELVIYNINLLILFTGLLRRTHKKFPLIKKNNSLTAQMISRFISQSKYSKHKAEFLFVLDGFGMMTFVHQSENAQHQFVHLYLWKSFVSIISDCPFVHQPLQSHLLPLSANHSWLGLIFLCLYSCIFGNIFFMKYSRCVKLFWDESTAPEHVYLE